jgi:hypothetical protein
VHFWSAHLDYLSYGPYAAFNKMVTDASQIMAGEMNLQGNHAGKISEFQNRCNLVKL